MPETFGTDADVRDDTNQQYLIWPSEAFRITEPLPSLQRPLKYPFIVCKHAIQIVGRLLESAHCAL
jgi:hypothetical protein